MRRRIPILAAAVAILVGASGAGATPVAAEGLSVPISTIIEASPGSVIELGRVAVDTELAGPDCTWTAIAVNQESVHLGSDISITSGGQELVLAGVEDTAGKVTSSSGSAYLVDEVIVSLRMGPDGVFSAGIDLTITYDGCQPVPVTQTTEVTPTSLVGSTPVTTAEVEIEPQGPTTAPPTTSLPTTASPTTVPPPTSAAPATQPILPVTGSPWLSILTTVGIAMLAAGTAITRWPRRDPASPNPSAPVER